MLRWFPFYPACPVCGDRAVNPGSLELRWAWDPETRKTVGRFRPGPEHTGYAGMLHGGLLSAILDECLAWACAVEKRGFCVTGDFHVRFKSPARLGETLRFAGWTVDSWGPYASAEGEVLTPEGGLVASATAIFSALSREQSEILQGGLLLRPGDIDILTGDPDPGQSPDPLPPRTEKH